MAEGKKPKRARRSFTDEFKAGAVRLVLDEGKTVPQVARDLDLTESSVRNWVEQARADRGKGKPGALTTAEKRGARGAAQGSPPAATGARHPKKSGGLLRQGEQLRFAFIHAEKACSRSRCARCSASPERASTPGLIALRRRTRPTTSCSPSRVREIHELTKKRYGAPRVQKELAKAQDIHVSQKRIARLMRQEGLRARPRKRFKCTTMSDHDQPVAANLLARNFEATAPNQKWVGDTTELLTGNGKLFLAVILDLFSKFVVGWALSPVNDRHLTIEALEMAIKRRCPGSGCSTTRTRGPPTPARTTRRSSPSAASSAA